MRLITPAGPDLPPVGTILWVSAVVLDHAVEGAILVVALQPGGEIASAHTALVRHTDCYVDVTPTVIK